MDDDIFFDSSPLMGEDFGMTPNLDPSAQIDAGVEAQGIGNTQGGSFLGTIGAMTAFTVPDVVDTVSSSLGFTDRGQITESMLGAFGSPKLMEFYGNHKDAVEVGSGIASVIGADFLAGRFLRPAGAMMRAASKLPYINRIASLDKQYQLAQRIAQTSMLRHARTGAIGIEQYSGQITLARLGTSGLQTTASGVNNIFTKAAIKKGFARNVTTEGILAVGANENEFLFSDDMSENIMWMAAGLGLGVAIDKMMSVHTLKKFANSDVMNRSFSKAYDPAGTEASRLGAALYSADLALGSTSHLGYLSGHHVDLATSYKLSADEGRNVDQLPGGNKNPLSPRRNRLATQQDEQVQSAMNKATSQGIGGVSGSAFGMNMEGYGNSINAMLHRDAASMYGVEELGAAGPGMTSFGINSMRQGLIDKRLDHVSGALREGGVWETRAKKNAKGIKEKIRVFRPLKPEEADAFRAEYRQLVFRNSLTEMHAIDGEWVPASVGRLFDEFVEPEIIKEETGNLKIWQVDKRETGKNIGVSSDLDLFLPQSPTGKSRLALEKLSLEDSIALYRSAQRAIRWFESTETKMVLPKKPNWFQLDMAEDLIRRTDNEDLVQWPAGLTRDDAKVESFKQKVQAIRKDKLLDQSDSSGAHIARFKFNLPRLSSYEAGLMGTEEHPIEVLLRGMGIKDLEGITHQDLVKGLKEVKTINGMTELTKDRSDDTLGNMFDFMLDHKGKVMKPVIGYKRPFAPHEFLKDNLSERLALRKMYFRNELTSANAGLMSREITDGILNDPDFIIASQVTGLQDRQLQSFMPGFSGAAPQSTRGGTMNDLVSREWRDRDTPTLLAAARLRDKVERKSRSIMQQRIEQAMGDIHTRLSGPRNGSSKLLVNQFLTFRAGWDLKTKLVNGKPVVQTTASVLPDGRRVVNFLLDEKSTHNKARFKSTYGRDLAADDVLLNPQGVKVGVDDLGNEFIQRFSKLTEDIHREKNTLNKAMGLGNINSVPYYAPPPNIKGKYVGFTLDHNNKPAPNGTIVASTLEEFTRLRNQLEDPGNKFSPLNKPGHRFMTQDEITDFNTIWDEAQMNMIDPGTTAIQPNKRAKGNLIGQEINPNAMEDALLWARDSYLKHGHDLISNIMKDQIIAAQTRAGIARESKRNALSGLREAKNRSVYDFYTENLLGRSAISSPGSLVGRVSQPVEDWINSALRGGKPVVSRVFRGATDWVREMTPKRSSEAKAQEAFKILRDSLGEYMPFKSTAEYVERTYQAKRPPELAQITGDMSRFEAAMRLRMFEVIHPLMNLTGMINAMPSVIRSMQPLLNESTEDFSRRVGHIAQIFELPAGKRIGMLDMPRMIHNTFKKAWSRERHADWDFMKSHGYVTQEVAELQKQFGAIKSREGWKAWALGDPMSTNPMKQKGLVGWVSVLSDRSEDFSRSWGHMVGLELAETLGITAREAKHSFAHDVANKMIANYDPKNRPAVFQGALGAPIGLFQSFIWNYYQRLFRYIETGDVRSAAIQYATQSAMFGMATVPGFDIVNKMFFDHSDGNNSPMDSMMDKFGSETGDFLMGGVLSNLPKLVNLLPGDQNVNGIDLYSRGDTNVRLPGFNPPPIVDTFKRIIGAITQGWAQFDADNPNLTSNQFAEIASNMLTNRPIAGFVETFFADGYDTDTFGQVAAESKTLMEATARVIGVRSFGQAKELEAFYANRNAQSLQRAQMSDLNSSARAAIRSGDIESLPDYFSQYVQRGGDPKRFNQWMKRNAEAALETRGERMLDDMSKNPAKAALMERLLDMGVSIQESDEMDSVPTYHPYDATDPNIGMESGPSITPIDEMDEL